MLLDSISKLEEVTNRKVNMHIVSPVSIKSMGRIMDEVDKIIVRYNISKGKRLDEIHSAVAYPEKEYMQKDDYTMYSKEAIKSYDRLLTTDISKYTIEITHNIMLNTFIYFI